MTRFLHSALSLGILFLALGSAGPAARAEADHGAVAEAALTKVIRPGYEAFADDAATLAAVTAMLCRDPSDKALADARAAFVAAVEGWSAVEIFQFGPVNHEHRYERLFFWPDRKGLGYRQVQRVLLDKDESVTSVGTLAKKSVALQGLPALEILLYGKGSDALASPGDDAVFRCRFAAAVTDNIAQLSKDLVEAWAPDAPFTKSFLEPEPDGVLYRAPKDVTLELFKAFSSGIERVRDQKLGRVLSESAERARPRLAAFWRSGQTFPNMTVNLQFVQALFVEGGFAGIVADQSPGVEDSVVFDLKRSIDVLGAETEPVAEVVTDPEQRGKLEALRVGLKSANTTASVLIAEGAGLSFGFNAGDGD
ncbi:imelysin family protein [Methyloceanibacter sp. wino2]|uniref:imelysin family protein n=1 Tax=Methyloceanibacter sp. wino2 TaxID=2170729 RepID=UPI00131F26BD|nr:imelysin family protein [Methyloceanibacter sp. wino2]